MNNVIVPLPGGNRNGGNRSILVFPHAGGSPRQYAMWSRLPAQYNWDLDTWGVTYPGRDLRMADPHPPTIQDLAREIADEVTSMPAFPSVMAGHSLGAIIAIETLLELSRRSPSSPLPALVISGQTAPEHTGGGNLYAATDQDLINELGRLNASTAQILANSEMAALHLPAIREDYRLIETYKCSVTRRLALDTEVLLVKGKQDSELLASEMADWHHWALKVTGPITVPGDHFHHLAHPELAVLSACIARGSPSTRTDISGVGEPMHWS